MSDYKIALNNVIVSGLYSSEEDGTELLNGTISTILNDEVVAFDFISIPSDSVFVGIGTLSPELFDFIKNNRSSLISIVLERYIDEY